MDSTQIQTSTTTKPSSESTSSSNNCKTAQNLTNNNSTSSNSSTNLTNSIINVNSSTTQTHNIATEQQTTNTISNQKLTISTTPIQQNTTITPTNVSAANLITSATLPIGQQTTTVQPQQIIQVSSQAGAIVPGQQLMVQTLAGRQSIQLRTQGGQQFQQIQLIPFGNLQGQNQRPVIIQQTPGNVIHSATGTITSMANLTQNNIAKLNNTATNTLPNNTTNLNSTHQKPVIIQQTTAAGQFIHSANAQALHNVTKIATVGRATNRTQTNSTGKMVLGHLTNSAPSINSGNINHQTTNHLVQANTATLTNNQVVNSANPQQVTRLNIISSIPGVHTSVANVTQHTGNGKPIINLATLNKPLIINPATSVVQPSIVGNVVNMSNFTNAHQLKQSNTTTNILPTVMTLATLTTSSNSLSTGRHTMIASTINHSQFNNSNNNNLNITQQQPQIISSSTNASQNNQQQQSQQANINQTLINHQSQLSTMRSNLLSNSTTNSNNNSSANTLNSPIKQISQQTPSSPRPSILIRKRVGPTLDLESKNSNYQSSLSTNNSQINSVKQNLSLKYNNSIVNNNSSLTSSINQLSSTNNTNNNTNNMKNAQDLLSKQQGVLNLKKQNLENNNSQLIKNENEQFIPSSSSLSSLSINQQSHHNQQNKSIDNLMNSTNQLTNQNNQITPRKRRKQLLEPFMLTSSQNIKLLNEDSNSTTNLLCNEDLLLRKKDNQQFNCHQISTINRRHRPSLLSTYNITWKSLQYHFLRHTEVKIKNEKKANQLELTNDNLKKRNSWKINHLSKQLEDILENEISFNQKLNELSKLYSDNKDNLPSKIKEIGSKPFNAKVCHNSITILDKLDDLFAANIQRSNLIHDQIKDTNLLLNKLSNDHNEKINKMTKRFLNKRNSSVKV